MTYCTRKKTIISMTTRSLRTAKSKPRVKLSLIHYQIFMNSHYQNRIVSIYAFIIIIVLSRSTQIKCTRTKLFK